MTTIGKWLKTKLEQDNEIDKIGDCFTIHNFRVLVEYLHDHKFIRIYQVDNNIEKEILTLDYIGQSKTLTIPKIIEIVKMVVMFKE